MSMIIGRPMIFFGLFLSRPDGLRVHTTEEFRGATGETLKDYDVVLINYDGKKLLTGEQ